MHCQTQYKRILILNRLHRTATSDLNTRDILLRDLLKFTRVKSCFVFSLSLSFTSTVGFHLALLFPRASTESGRESSVVSLALSIHAALWLEVKYFVTRKT